MIISAIFPLANAMNFIYIRMQMQKNKEQKYALKSLTWKKMNNGLYGHISVATTFRAFNNFAYIIA